MNRLGGHEYKPLNANGAHYADDGAILFDPLALGDACFASEDRAKLASDWVSEGWSRNVSQRREEAGVQYQSVEKVAEDGQDDDERHVQGACRLFWR